VGLAAHGSAIVGERKVVKGVNIHTISLPVQNKLRVPIPASEIATFLVRNPLLLNHTCGLRVETYFQ
jgi:hypothetical protein